MGKYATNSADLQVVEAQGTLALEVPLPILRALTDAENALFDLWILMDHNRRQIRARSVLRGSARSLGRALPALLERPTEVDAYHFEILELCQRQVSVLGQELVRSDNLWRQVSRVT